MIRQPLSHRLGFLALFSFLTCSLVFPSLVVRAADPAQDVLRGAWEHFHGRVIQPVAGPNRPGKFLGDAAQLRVQGADADWRFRAVTWEASFASSADLARCVYTLALSAGDITPDVGRDRFERGVQGFHYDLDQISAWVNQVLRRQLVLQAEEERFLLWLLVDGVVEIRDGRAKPGGTVRHVLGAAAGKKRSLADNLAHERLHVLWDEDAAFRAAGEVLWKSLDRAEKEAVYRSLPGYSQEKEAQIMEEWYVRRMETSTPARRKGLVGL